MANNNSEHLEGILGQENNAIYEAAGAVILNTRDNLIPQKTVYSHDSENFPTSKPSTYFRQATPSYLRIE